MPLKYNAPVRDDSVPGPPVPAPRPAVPSPEECLGLLRLFKVPGHIRRHSELVARLSWRLASDLNRHVGSRHDADLLRAAALLHDIAKTFSGEGLTDHAAEGARILRERGLSRIADLVERHIDPGPGTEHLRDDEILAYCDKRVRHEDLVSLEERYLDLLTRYGGGHTSAESYIRDNWRRMAALEMRIFSSLPYPPAGLKP